MILTKEIKTLEAFESLKAGDFLAVQFHRNVYEGKSTTDKKFGVYQIDSIKTNTKEIILNKKWNTYFNYSLFLDPKESSNLKSAILLTINEE